MDVLVAELLQVELLAGSAQVAILVEVSLDVAIDRGHQHEAADVEFASIYEQRVSQILLEHDRSALVEGDAHSLFYIFERVTDCDANAPVGVLARFHDPHIFKPLAVGFLLALFFGFFLFFFELLPPLAWRHELLFLEVSPECLPLRIAES